MEAHSLGYDTDHLPLDFSLMRIEDVVLLVLLKASFLLMLAPISFLPLLSLA